MRFGINRPPNITWALSGSAGSAFVSPSSYLTNGRPAQACRLTAPTLATTAATLVLTGTLNQVLSCGCICVIFPMFSTATLVPANVAITASGKLTGGAVVLGGNALTTVTQTLANGAIAVWFVFPSVNIDTIIITIPNLKGAAAWWTANMPFDIGEIWCGQCADFQLALNPDDEMDGGLLQRQTHNNQAWPLLVEPARQLTYNLVPMNETAMIGPTTQPDFEQVRYALSTQPCCVAIKYFLNTGNAPNNVPKITSATINTQRLHRSALLGVLGAPIKISGSGDVFYVAPVQMVESPP
jgi:hypothetical protein